MLFPARPRQKAPEQHFHNHWLSHSFHFSNTDAALGSHQLSKSLKMHRFKEEWWWGSHCQVTNPAPTRKKQAARIVNPAIESWGLIWRASGKVQKFSSSSVWSHILKPGDSAEKNPLDSDCLNSVCSRRTDKRSFDPKQKLNKGPKDTMIKEVAILGDFSGGGAIASLVWKFWQRWL